MPDDYPPDTIAAMALWLARRTGRLRQHEAAAEAVSEITAAVRQAQRAIDRPPGRAYAGPCGVCGRHLYVRPGKATVTCDGHEPPWSADVEQRREWMLGQITDQLSYAAEAVHLLSLLGVRVSAVQVTRWVADGRLVAHGTDQHRRALYRLGDLTVLAMTTRRTA